MTGLGLQATILQVLFQSSLPEHSFQILHLPPLEILQHVSVALKVCLINQESQRMGPGIQRSVTFSGLGSKQLCKQRRRPGVSQQMSYIAVGSSWVCSQYVFFYCELLTSHLVIIIFMKQPKQRSLSLEEFRPYISWWCFPSTQVLTRKTGFPNALTSHRQMKPKQPIQSQKNSPIICSSWSR